MGRVPAALRWIVSTSLAGVITAALFVAMTRLATGEFILRSIFQLFPLVASESASDCLEVFGQEIVPVTIRGEVGYFDAGFVPLSDASVFQGEGADESLASRSSTDGSFEFVTDFVQERSSSCADAAAPPRVDSKQITLRAPRCAERRVPITPAWVPHRVVLECDERRRKSP